MTRDTVGKLSSELLTKSIDNDHSAEEQMREQLDRYDANFYECLNREKSNFSGPFHIVVITKRERLMQNVFRNYFFARSSCPTPDWDQTVYRYDPKDESIKMLWVIPSKDTCEYMTYYPEMIPKEERALMGYVHDLNSGALLRYAKKLNNEQDDSPLLN